jgi:hypothetical protein
MFVGGFETIFFVSVLHNTERRAFGAARYRYYRCNKLPLHISSALVISRVGLEKAVKTNVPVPSGNQTPVLQSVVVAVQDGILRAALKWLQGKIIVNIL